MKRSPNFGARALRPTISQFLLVSSLAPLALLGAGCTDTNGFQPGEPKPPEKTVRFLQGECPEGNPEVEESTKTQVVLTCPYGGELSKPRVFFRRPKNTNEGNTVRVVLDRPSTKLKPIGSSGGGIFATTGGEISEDWHPRRL